MKLCFLIFVNFMLKVSIYSGEGYEDPNELGETGPIILHLMDGYLDKG